MRAMNADELMDFLRREFPQSRPDRYRIEAVGEGRLVMRFTATAEDLRPGDTVSGPTLMEAADMGMYLALLSVIGPVALAVTTSLNINFLRRPRAGELVVETILLKVGQQLAVGEVAIRAPQSSDVIAHATATYSIPKSPL